MVKSYAVLRAMASEGPVLTEYKAVNDLGESYDMSFSHSIVRPKVSSTVASYSREKERRADDKERDVIRNFNP